MTMNINEIHLLSLMKFIYEQIYSLLNKINMILIVILYIVMRKFLVMLQTLSFLMVELRMNAIRINLKFYRLPKMRYARFLPVLYLGAEIIVNRF